MSGPYFRFVVEASGLRLGVLADMGEAERVLSEAQLEALRTGLEKVLKASAPAPHRRYTPDPLEASGGSHI